MKQLRKIQQQHQAEIDEVINRLLSECKVEYNNEGVRGFVADTHRGFAHYDGQFTVPQWAYDKQHLSQQDFEKKHCVHAGWNKVKAYKKEGYFIYYVAHELAHQLRYIKYNKGGGHDFRFYEIFMDICPKDYQHHELNYKKTASKYGIKYQ